MDPEIPEVDDRPTLVPSCPPFPECDPNQTIRPAQPTEMSWWPPELLRIDIPNIKPLR